MRALFFSPYLDILGGGELYTLSWAKFLNQKGYEVTLAWHHPAILRKIKERFNFNLKNVEVNPSFYDLFSKKTPVKEKYRRTRNFDFIFYLSDGSIPFLFGKKNFIHFQVPFTKRPDSRLINLLKFRFINKVICNSRFTKSFIDKTYQVNSQVIYPYAQKVFSPGAKKDVILSVGRFDKTVNQKKQEVLITAFAMLSKKIKGWQLVLAGGSQDKKRLENLQRQSRGMAIKIMPNIPFKKLVRLYSQAKIYWQATGFGEELKREPERAEHFGITVVEAMRSGVVPVVFNGGGMPEIVEQQKNGFLFNDLKELNTCTEQLMSLEDKRKSLAEAAKKRAEIFSEKNFYSQIDKLLPC